MKKKWLAVLLLSIVTGCTEWPVATQEITGADGTGAENAKVTIYRDDWGIPHLYADKEEAGFFGLGYAEAEDQLEVILGSLIWAVGRRAELEGEAHLATDIEMRRWRHLEEAQAGFPRMSPQLQKNYRSFVAGVKRYMADNPEAVPSWAPELTPESLVAINRAFIWFGYHMVDGPKECEKTGAVLDASLLVTLEQPPERASNGWVVMPSRSTSGATIVGADPHVSVQNPAYYEYRIDAGPLKSAGFSMGPMLWQAHNRHVAWAMTTGNTDMWDCYAVKVDPENPQRYRYDGEWQQLETREETFRTLEGAELTQVYHYTHHNDVLSPVVARKGDKIYAVSTSQMHDAGVLDEEIYNMNLARSVEDVKAAMSSLAMLPQNVLVGDSQGNAFYLRAGKTPRRPKGFDWTASVPGNSSDTAWLGYHSLEEMVQVENPSQGYIQNNNVAPDQLFGEGNIKADDYPAYLFNDTPGRSTTRGKRAIEILSREEKISLDDAIALAFDEKWITTDAWLRALEYSVAQYPELVEKTSANTRQLIESLLAFDGFARAESVGALHFYIWRQEMGAVLSRPEFENLNQFPWQKSQFTKAFAVALIEQAEQTVNTLTMQFGNIDQPLGALFRIGRGSETWPLGGESIRANDSWDCIAFFRPLCDRTQRAFESAPADAAGERRVFRGSQATRVVMLGDPIRSYSLHNHGQNNSTVSPHYSDQAKLSSEKKLKPTYFNREELNGHIVSTLELQLELEL